MAPGADPETAKHVQIEAGKKCYIRTGPGTEHKAIGVASYSDMDKLEYAGETAENGWFKVKYKDDVAWVSGKYGKLVD
ncbi:MAG: SH3 domain-containing protein [bacterium]